MSARRLARRLLGPHVLVPLALAVAAGALLSLARRYRPYLATTSAVALGLSALLSWSLARRRARLASGRPSSLALPSVVGAVAGAFWVCFAIMVPGSLPAPCAGQPLGWNVPGGAAGVDAPLTSVTREKLGNSLRYASADAAQRASDKPHVTSTSSLVWEGWDGDVLSRVYLSSSYPQAFTAVPCLRDGAGWSTTPSGFLTYSATTADDDGCAWDGAWVASDVVRSSATTVREVSPGLSCCGAVRDVDPSSMEVLGRRPDLVLSADGGDGHTYWLWAYGPELADGVSRALGGGAAGRDVSCGEAARALGVRMPGGAGE